MAEVNSDGQTKDLTIGGVAITLPRVVVSILGVLVAYGLPAYENFLKLDVVAQVAVIAGLVVLGAVIVVCYTWSLIANKRVAEAKNYGGNPSPESTDPNAGVTTAAGGVGGGGAPHKPGARPTSKAARSTKRKR